VAAHSVPMGFAMQLRTRLFTSPYSIQTEYVPRLHQVVPIESSDYSYPDVHRSRKDLLEGII
jgi:hypothetical protein